MSKIILDELFVAQRQLDETIANNHGVSYSSTRHKRILSLVVEIGELANATRCFKYWSNKPSESKERILDEYADGLHFFLSLGIDINTNKKVYHLSKHEDNLTDQFLLVYRRIDEFYKHQDDRTYIRAFQAFLNLLPLLGYRYKELEKAYYQKLGVNYHRQETNY